MTALTNSVRRGVPAALTELVTLGRTLKKRAALADSTAPAHPTARPKPSTADSNICTAPTSASGTSPTASPDHCWRRATSAPDYTHDCDEPHQMAPAMAPPEAGHPCTLPVVRFRPLRLSTIFQQGRLCTAWTLPTVSARLPASRSRSLSSAEVGRGTTMCFCP